MMAPNPEQSQNTEVLLLCDTSVTFSLIQLDHSKNWTISVILTLIRVVYNFILQSWKYSLHEGGSSPPSGEPFRRQSFYNSGAISLF